jgi:hypothetical protein
MNKERPLPTSVAAVVLALLSAAGLAAPLLLGGGVPATAIYVGVATGAAGLAAAHGLWTLKRWGTVIAVIVTVLGILSAAPGLAFAPTPGLLVQAVGGSRAAPWSSSSCCYRRRGGRTPDGASGPQGGRPHGPVPPVQVRATTGT